ncbi:biosynthetic-type acetolactate synthase large subunit [Proteocatella sphenisci]|uniref:biosynthetic-type acetolactate synthase large subunit n=1 Tax=Proteocatella sphenisci TaxID=181070 RepID=UPI00048FE885|nr:biosynthetic-type acetolactate synthase large subunit [Proteocatella sphenisci]
MQLTGSQIIAEVLLEQGTDTIFGYPGGTVLNIYDELYKYQDKLRHVTTAHEQGATHAADGYARSTGKTGVVLVTSGPGATNAVTGIATAYMDSIPMVVITGNVSCNLIGKDSFQEVYTEGISFPITKHSFSVRNIEKLADNLRDAFRIAQSGRPGPVLVDIPKDITADTCEFTSKEREVAHTKNLYTMDQIHEAAALINNAQKPVVYYGGGVVSADASELLYNLVHKAFIPSCHTIMGTGVLSYNDPLELGIIGMHGTVSAGLAVKNCDLLIAIGARFSDRVATDVSKFADGAKIIQIDIDPSELNKNVLVDIGIVGNMHDILNNLLPLVNPSDDEQWMNQIAKWQDELDYKPEDSDKVIKPHQLFAVLEKVTDLNTIIATDVGQHQMWASQYCGRTKARSFLTSGGLGTMGYGYGAAIGAQIGNPDSRVIHITGDGSFHMNLNELCTTVSYELPVITIILNNSVLGMVRQWQTKFYEQRYSCTSLERKTDFVKIAEAFGGRGYRAENIAEFEKALELALQNKNGPTLIDCVIDKDESVYPMIPAGKSIDDVMLA